MHPPDYRNVRLAHEICVNNMKLVEKNITEMWVGRIRIRSVIGKAKLLAGTTQEFIYDA